MDILRENASCLLTTGSGIPIRWFGGSSEGQNVTRAPNWIWRIGCADVIRPKFAVPNVAFGLSKLAMLNTLKTSARNCSCLPTPSPKFLASDKSVTTLLGPRRWLRGALPNVNCAGSAYAVASMQLTSLPAPQSADGVPTRSGL